MTSSRVVSGAENEAPVVVEIRESAVPGTSFALPVAVDPDGPQYGVRTYELVDLSETGSDVMFGLDIVTRPRDQLEPRLVIRRPLDREQVRLVIV